MRSNIKLQLTIGLFLLRDVPDIQPFRNQLRQQRIDSLLIKAIKPVRSVDDVLHRIILHGRRQTRGIREVIDLLKESKPIIERLPILLGVSVVDTFATKQLNVAREHIKDFIASFHALRGELNTDFKCSVIAIERLVTRRHQFTDESQ